MISKATILGRIGKKDFRETKNGSQVATLSIATKRKWVDSQGQPQEQTTWHNVNFFNKMADIANKYGHVGDLVYIEGEIINKKIESGERSGQWIYSIHGNEIRFIPNTKREKPVQDNNDNHFDDSSEIPF